MRKRRHSLRSTASPPLLGRCSLQLRPLVSRIVGNGLTITLLLGASGGLPTRGSAGRRAPSAPAPRFADSPGALQGSAKRPLKRARCRCGAPKGSGAFPGTPATAPPAQRRASPHDDALALHVDLIEGELVGERHRGGSGKASDLRLRSERGRERARALRGARQGGEATPLPRPPPDRLTCLPGFAQLAARARQSRQGPLGRVGKSRFAWPESSAPPRLAPSFCRVRIGRRQHRSGRSGWTVSSRARVCFGGRRCGSFAPSRGCVGVSCRAGAVLPWRTTARLAPSSLVPPNPAAFLPDFPPRLRKTPWRAPAPLALLEHS